MADRTRAVLDAYVAYQPWPPPDDNEFFLPSQPG